MLEYFNEENSWDILKNSPQPIAVYGMGDGSEKIINTLKSFGRDVDEIFASDEFVRGHSFLGRKVLKYSEVCDKYDNFTVVLGFAVHDEKMLSRIKEINKCHTVIAPDVPVAGSGLFTWDFVEEHEEDFDFIYQNLADERSKKVFSDIVKFKISGKVDYLYSAVDDKGEVYSDILRLNDHETIIDLGAYDGDTVREFLSHTDGKYEHIIAVEPDEKNFKKLNKNTAGMENITLLNIGAWSKKDNLIFAKKAGRNSKLTSEGVLIPVDSVDNICADKDITMIKMDIEGSELQALEGAKETIKRCSPKLYICAYHRNEDMFALPKKVLDIDPDYKIYFRHSPYIPAWESNFYCVKE